METKKHTTEPWSVGGNDAMPHTHHSQLVGLFDDGDGSPTPFVMASFNHNFAELSVANACRAVSCVNALAGIPDPAKYTQSVERLVEAAKKALPFLDDDCQDEDGKCINDQLRSALADMEQGGANAQ